jgi:hypothetical protein
VTKESIKNIHNVSFEEQLDDGREESERDMSGGRQEDRGRTQRVEASRREGQRDKELDHFGESETEHRVSF